MPWNASTLTRGVPAAHTGVTLIPDTGAIAARRPGSAQASRVENIAPFEMPVAKIRFGSMHSVPFVVRSIAWVNATSGLAAVDGSSAQWRSTSP